MDVSDKPGAQETPTPWPGLQAERTDLSWTRSSLAFLVNGALLLVRHELIAPSTVHLVACAIALLLALFAAIMAYRRRRILAARPLPESPAAPMALFLLGMGTAVLGVVALVVIVIG